MNFVSLPVGETGEEGRQMEKTILIVDDDPTLLTIAEMILLKGRYRVITAKSGLEGLATLARGGVDLLLLDIDMPFMDGFQTLEKLRRDPELAALPVIFLTGKAEEEAVRRAKSLNARGYVLKPIKQDLLMAKVRQALG